MDYGNQALEPTVPASVTEALRIYDTLKQQVAAKDYTSASFTAVGLLAQLQRNDLDERALDVTASELEAACRWAFIAYASQNFLLPLLREASANLVTRYHYASNVYRCCKRWALTAADFEMDDMALREAVEPVLIEYVARYLNQSRQCAADDQRGGSYYQMFLRLTVLYNLPVRASGGSFLDVLAVWWYRRRSA